MDAHILPVCLKPHLSLMVQVVEVLPDSRFGALALDVGSGSSGGGVAGGKTAQGGPEEHDRGRLKCSGMNKKR